MIKPEFIQTITDTLVRINGRLSQANSATLTLLLLILALCIWLSYGTYVYVKMKQRIRLTDHDLENSVREVASLETKVNDISHERAENDLMERTKRLISSMTNQEVNKSTWRPRVEFRPEGGDAAISLNPLRAARSNININRASNSHDLADTATTSSFRGQASFKEDGGI